MAERIKMPFGKGEGLTYVSTRNHGADPPWKEALLRGDNCGEDNKMAMWSFAKTLGHLLFKMTSSMCHKLKTTRT